MTSPQPDVNLYVSTPNLQKTSCWTHCSSVKDLVYCMWRQGNITTQSPTGPHTYVIITMTTWLHMIPPNHKSSKHAS